MVWMKVGLARQPVANLAQRLELLAQHALIRLQRAQPPPVARLAHGPIDEARAVVGIVGAFQLRAPVLDMIAGARVDLHVIPIVGAIVL